MYHNFKSVNNDCFEEELSSKLDLNNKDYAIFEYNFVNILNKHAPHTKLSCLKNKANKSQLPSDKQNYKKKKKKN